MQLTRREVMGAGLASLLPTESLVAGRGFEARTFARASGDSMPYRIFAPTTAKGRLPVILWLHGAGGRGSDNISQITGGNSLGSSIWITEQCQQTTPAIVLAPQCPADQVWASMDERVKPTRHLENALAILDTIATSPSVDGNRMYVVGQSMGAFGAWALAAEHPDKFAALIALCGGGNIDAAANLARIPAWAFHGDLDQAVPISRSRTLIAAIRRAGGSPRYTEYPTVGHAVWETAFREPLLIPWLFDQRRNV